MKKAIIVTLLLAAGLLVRLYKIDSPLADWHSWRQVDTAAVARNFVENGYDLLHPKFNDLSSAPSTLENPEGHRFVEFPIYNATHALLYQLVEKIKPGEFTFETVGRLTTVFCSLGGAIFLYLIVTYLLGEGLGILSLAFFLFLPFNIYYSRTVLPGQMMTFFTLASIYFLLISSEKRSSLRLAISLIFSMAAVLVKPYAVFFLVPSWLVIFRKKLDIKRIKTAFVYVLLSAIPFILWRFWIKQFPEGIPTSGWLLNKDGIRLRPAWWRWLFGERIGSLILGHWGTAPLLIGIISKIKKKDTLFYSWLVGASLYLVIFAGGNVTHDYYQMLIVPTLCVFLAKGVYFLATAPSNYFNKLFAGPLVVFISLLAIAFSWYYVKEYYKINRMEIVLAGQEADKILPKDAKVIAPYNGDTAFLYHTNRQGWPLITRSLKETIQLGATHYVSVNRDPITALVLEKCSVLEETDQWFIVDLRPCTEELTR